MRRRREGCTSDQQTKQTKRNVRRETGMKGTTTRNPGFIKKGTPCTCYPVRNFGVLKKVSKRLGITVGTVEMVRKTKSTRKSR